MKHLTFLITAGPTQEPLDPVRFLSNYSSGKMGYALANAALKKKYSVILIHGPTALTPPPQAKTIEVQTALEMRRQVQKYFSEADIIIKVAAVADYRPHKIFRQKIKKNTNTLTLTLIKNPDILFELGKKKKRHQTLVGFAAETTHILKHARKKLRQKNCDWIVANDVSNKALGFGSDQNKVIMLSSQNDAIYLDGTKKKIAKKIIDILVKERR